MRGVRLLILSLAAAWVCAARAEPVQGAVEAVGFAAGRSGGCIRAGQWFPVRVQFAVQGTGLYTRELRLEGIDLDGDRVVYGQPQVTLSSEGGEKKKRVWCYTVANASNELPAQVDVLDERGVSVDKLPFPPLPCELMSNDDLLILDLSGQEIVALNLLGTPNWTPGQRADAARTYYRNVAVSKLAAADLPDSWLGLEAVDVVVWDQPSAADLQRTAQVDALIEWVQNGGQLIVGIGASWAAIQENSALAAIMPVKGRGTQFEAASLRTFFDRMAAPAVRSRELDHPVVVTSADLAEGAVRTLGESGPQGPINLITMRTVGSGRVVATAASLRDLTTHVVLAEDKFFAALLELNQYTEKFKQAQNSMTATLLEPQYLYEPLTEPISFGTATAVRGLLAFLFVGGYIVLATLASWAWLKRRKLAHQSWTAFAFCAIAASALSLVTVRAMQGISGGVQSLCIVDLQAGDRAARGSCWFGYRSPTRQLARLSLPGEGDFLRPLARAPRNVAYYVTPARFAGVPLKGRLDDVLLRATLKQVEGYWHGELDGSIRGDLVVDRGTGRLTPASWILNELSADLEGAYLLFLDPRQDDGGVPRAAGVTKPYALPDTIVAQPDLKVVPPARDILAVGMGRIPAGQRSDGLGVVQYREVDKAWQDWLARADRRRSDMPDLATLWDEQQRWRSVMSLTSTLDRPVRAALLASTRNYCLHNRGKDFDSPDVDLSTDGLPRLDISHWLLGGREAGQAILLCWSNAPGPAQLSVDDKPKKAYAGLTIYRVQIPIRYVGSPPAAGEGSAP